MANHYEHLSLDERLMLQAMLVAGRRESDIARVLGRHRSTISGELKRNGARLDRDSGHRTPYDANAAHKRYTDRLAAPRERKLAEGTPLLAHVREKLRQSWSPEQIAGELKQAHPDASRSRVCHETIYTAIYVMARGALKAELVAALPRRSAKRRPRSAGRDRRRIADMTSIHVRPPEVEQRAVPGHWEGDLIKGARNASAIGTLVERTSRLVKLVRMPSFTAAGALEAFTTAFASVDGAMMRTLTYDQGVEMARHKDLTLATGLKVYFADPHSPWQRGSNENMNGLVRAFYPKGMDLSGVTQEELDYVANLINTRPRKMHKFKTPLAVYEAHIRR